MPRPKIPTATKIAMGNPGQRRLEPETESQPEKTMPVKPKGLPKQASKFWDDMAPKLFKCELLTEADGQLFAITAITYARWLDLEEKLKADGITQMAKRGEVPSATFRSLMATIDQLCKLFNYFGMSPSARSGIKIRPSDPHRENPLKKLQEKNREKREKKTSGLDVTNPETNDEDLGDSEKRRRNALKSFGSSLLNKDSLLNNDNDKEANENLNNEKVPNENKDPSVGGAIRNKSIH